MGYAVVKDANFVDGCLVIEWYGTVISDSMPLNSLLECNPDLVEPVCSGKIQVKMTRVPIPEQPPAKVVPWYRTLWQVLCGDFS